MVTNARGIEDRSKARDILDFLEADKNNGRKIYNRLSGLANRKFGIYGEDLDDAFQYLYISILQYSNGFRGQVSNPPDFNDPILNSYITRAFISGCMRFFSDKFPRTYQIDPEKREIFDTEAFNYRQRRPERDHEEIARRLDLIERAVSRLNPIHRETFALRYFEGLNVKAVAKRLKKPVGTVKRRLHTARKQLQEMVA